MAVDPRRIVGSIVEAKACHVMNLAECSRCYGSNSKTKRVQGIVTHVEVIKNLILKVVKTAEEENTSAVTEDDGNNHGTNVLKFLVEPWVRMDRCVCADSYFASINAVTVMRTMGLHFIGVVKTATKKFPMSYLSNLELVQHGDYKGLMARGADGQPTMLSFIWMDQDCHYFVASVSLLDSGILYSHNRWRQVSLELDALCENVELTIPQPKVTEVYYRTCGVINQHN